MSDKHVVIIGGGYAGITCAQSLRSENNSNVKVSLISYELFCSRPNLFFRYKFLNWDDSKIDYGLIDEKEFCSKYNIQLYLHSHVSSVCPVSQKIIIERMQDGKTNTQELSYDKLVFATGGIPNYVHFKKNVLFSENKKKDNDVEGITEALKQIRVEEKSINEDDYQQLSPLVKKWYNVESLPTGMYLVRNTEEIKSLFKVIQKMYAIKRENKSKTDLSDDECDILVVGAGALSMDIVTCLLDGYENAIRESKMKREDLLYFEEVEYLPKIKVLGRGKLERVGYSLLQDEDACKIILEKSKKVEPYNKYLSFEMEDSIDKVNIEKRDGVEHIVGISSQKCKEIKCSVIVQAIGVNPNTKLAASTNVISIGEKKGILVDSRLECQLKDESVKKSTLFACGDCCELTQNVSESFINGGSYRVNEKETTVWKNWTSSREQAVECAKSILADQYKCKNLWFNQTLRMFGLYVACLGQYSINSEYNQDKKQKHFIVKSIDEKKYTFAKLVFLIDENSKEIESCKLIGSLILGSSIKEYKLGQSVFDIMKLNKYIPVKIAHQFLEGSFQYSKLLKMLKSGKSLKQILDEEKPLLTAPAKPTRKFKNPIKKKK